MTPIGSSPKRRRRPTRQRGMVTIVAVLFLIATVVFVLSQMLNVSSDNVIDGQRQGDSTAAFFLAESGLDKAKAIADAALAAGNYTNAVCTGLQTDYTDHPLGRGSFSLTAVSEPSTCPGGGATCVCTVTAVAKVGLTQRTLTQDLVMATVDGIFCNNLNADCRNTPPPATWQLSLKNTAVVAGIGVFNLAYNGHGNNQATCVAMSGGIGTDCAKELDLDSPSNGGPSVGIMGNAVVFQAAGQPGDTYSIYQTVAGNYNVVQVGAFFLGTTAPQFTGPVSGPWVNAYWDSNKNNDNTRTVGKAVFTGGTNDGTANSTDTCLKPAANTTPQTCSSWCYGGDTLVFSFAGTTSLLTDQLNSVAFGTGTSQIQMKPATRYPSPFISGAPTNVHAEIWYARNPNFTGASPLAVNASSYKGRGTGAVGAAWTTSSSSDTSISGTTM